MKTARWTLVGWGAALLMLATIVAISISGEWPADTPLEQPDTQGILPLPPTQVARVEVAEGDKRTQFSRSPSGGWLIDAAQADAAIAGHLDAALRLANHSAPDRVFAPSEYSDRKLADFGLDPPRMRVSIIARDGATSSIAFGDLSPTQISQYARVNGRAELYLLSRYFGAEWQLALDMAGRSSAGATVAAGNADRRSPSLLCPVSIARIWAVELVTGGRLVRFERDPAGNWFHHVGEHIHKPGGLVHQADPVMAPLIAAELAGIDTAPANAPIAQKPDDTAIAGFGLQHPSNILLLYSRDSSQAVARIEIGGPAPDGREIYASVQGSDVVVTVPASEVSHLRRLVELAGSTS